MALLSHLTPHGRQVERVAREATDGAVWSAREHQLADLVLLHMASWPRAHEAIAALNEAGYIAEPARTDNAEHAWVTVRRAVCPDGGRCHHGCGTGPCWRVSTCGPLSGVFPDDRWPADVVAKHTPEPELRLVREPLPDPDQLDAVAFTRHCVDRHDMDETTIFNVPTTRAYHAHLHGYGLTDHTHEGGHTGNE